MGFGRLSAHLIMVSFITSIRSEGEFEKAKSGVHANSTYRANDGLEYPTALQPFKIITVDEWEIYRDSSPEQNVKNKKGLKMSDDLFHTIHSISRSRRFAVDDGKPSDFLGGTFLIESIIKSDNYICGRNSVCNQSLNQYECPIAYCSNCKCDTDCLRFQDCCPDVYLTKTTHPPDGLTCVSQGFKETAFQPSKRYLMIGVCPQQQSHFEMDEVIWLSCENPDLTNVTESTPVFARVTGLHYRNQFCADCWGVSEFETWTMNSFCTDHVDYNSMASLGDYQDYVMKQESCGIYAYPPDIETVRECISTSAMVTRCNVTGDWQEGLNNTDIELGCAFYTHPVKVGDVVYKNTVCALCNGRNLYRDECPEDTEQHVVAPFSVLINFRAEEDGPDEHKIQLTHTPDCQNAEILDSKSNVCRKLVCPVGKYLENHTCHNMFDSAKGIGYVLNYSLKPINKQFALIRSSYGMIDIAESFVGYLEAYMETTFSRSWHNFMLKYLYKEEKPIYGKDIYYIKNITIQLAFVVHSNVPRYIVERSMIDLVKRGYFYYNDDDAFPEMYTSVWLADTDEAYFTKSRETTKNINLTGEIFIELTYIYSKRTRPTDPFVPGVYKDTISAYIRISEIMHCEQIQLNASDYLMQDNGIIFVNQSGSETQLQPGQYQKMGSNVRVCADMIADTSSSSGVDDGADMEYQVFDQTEIILTIVCTSLSLLGLSTTLIVYSSTPSLHALLPNKTNMALWTNLFMAQLLYITLAVANVPLQLCRFFAIVIHYFWLSTFAWKLICGFHLFRKFNNPFMVQDEMRSFTRYTLFSQCFPILVIGVNILIHYLTSGQSEIGYAGRVIGPDRRLCFLTEALDVGFTFALPIGLVVLINTFFFGSFIHSLRNKPNLQKHASKSDVKQRLAFIKVSFLLGFTWGIGFIAVGANVPAMWYVFTVFNASLGVFIFLSFGLKSLSIYKIIPEFSTKETSNAVASKRQPSGDID